MINFVFRVQRYKNYAIYAKKMQNNLVNSKKSSTFAPAFDEKLYIVATLAQLVEQRIRNA